MPAPVNDAIATLVELKKSPLRACCWLSSLGKGGLIGKGWEERPDHDANAPKRYVASDLGEMLPVIWLF
jgi:hypothetical protein